MTEVCYFFFFRSPDQNPKVICEYVRESLAGRHAPLHTVAYDCSISATNVRTSSNEIFADLFLLRLLLATCKIVCLVMRLHWSNDFIHERRDVIIVVYTP